MTIKEKKEIYSLKQRLSFEDIVELSKKVMIGSAPRKLLDKIPDIVILLNKTRQIVFANKILLEYLSLEDDSSILGKRPGEILKCNHAFETEFGCGNSKSCTECGALLSILSSLNEQDDSKECRIYNEEIGKAYDFKVKTSSIILNEEFFIVFSLTEINDEKRRKVLEKIFFHDIANTAVGFLNLAELLKVDLPDEFNRYKQFASQLAKKLLSEITAQKQLLAAENNELQVYLEKANSISIIKEVIDVYMNFDISRDKEILIDNNSVNINFRTDIAILGRILSNLLKNALEASRNDKLIIIGCNEIENEIQLWVKNESYIPSEVQLQIFHRSFSTKGLGRGIGTYSVKLLTEKYLKGSVSFKSTKEDGTTFFVNLPKNV